jgi:CheY-like chemotaxis protein
MPEISLQPLHGPEEGRPAGKVTAARFPYIIGRRHGCCLRISDACVSREHCRLIERAGGVWVEDLASLNGTFVNEERVRQPRPLRDGDVLRVAYMTFMVHAAADDRTVVQMEEDAWVGVRQVLVVEDDAEAAESLALLLKDWGCEVQVAHDVGEALRAARDHPPDAVLLDVRLPGMDGYQLARRLREEGLAAAQMVAMTGSPEDAARRNPNDTGVQKVLMKPVGADALREVLAGA